MKTLVISTLFLFVYSEISAQTIQLKNSDQHYSLDASFQIFADETHFQSITEVLANENDKSFLPQDFSLEAHQFYWAKTTITNQVENAAHFSEWILQLSLILTEVEVFVVKNNIEIQSGKTGFFVPPNQRTFAPIIKANLAKITLPANEKITIFLKFKSDRIGMPIRLESSIQHSTNFFIQLKKRNQITILFIGFMLMMFIYNLFLYAFARDKTYIFYSIYLGGLLAFILYNAGDLAQVFTPIFFPEMPELIYFFKATLYLSFMGYLAFIRSFLNLKQLLPKWDKILKYLSILIIPSFLSDLYFMLSTNYNYNAADMTGVVYVFIFLLTTFGFLIPLYRTKHKAGIFIIIGVLLMGSGIVLTLYSRFQTVDFSTTYFKIGTILEVIVFSLGLAYRQREMEIARQNAAFELEKTKIREAEEHRELIRQKELNDLKSGLYTNITHEFRTPLTVIMGMAENLKNDAAAKNLILRNSENLLNLINQMLDLAKLESGKLAVNWVQADIVAYLRYLTESFLSLAMEKDIRLAFYTESTSVMMDFDDKKIQQIVYNLLFNAIKFTPEYGKIVFHCKEIKEGERHFLQIKVQDTGQGISEKDLPYIFDRFRQGSENHQGTGIGLALTKELTQLLGGKISVKSTLKEGSEFKIILPIHQNAVVQNPMEFSLIRSKKIIEPTIEEESFSTVAEKPQLLLIEDNADVVIYIERILKHQYEISTAQNGKIGIEKAIASIPDIIISDVLMPEKNGFEVCEILKKDARTSHIPIILLTAKTTFEDKLTGLKVGAEAYLPKPFQKEELLVRLEKLVEMRKLLQQRFSGTTTIPENSEVAKLINLPLEDNFLKDLNAIILVNIDNPDFGVKELANGILMSQVQVYRKLKALTGLTPVQFIRKVRLKRAVELLQNSELNVSEVAYEVGFSDPNYFSRVFQQEFGRPPSSMRGKK